jgi:hypothetical protein
LPVGIREGADGALAIVDVVALFARAREADEFRTMGVMGDERAGGDGCRDRFSGLLIMLVLYPPFSLNQ